MSRGPKPAAVRFYFDADVLGLAKVICALRADSTYPGDPGALIRKRLRPPCIVSDPSTLDVDWIPAVTEAGWLIITRDSRIQHHLAELEAVRANGAKMVALSGREGQTKWTQLEIVMSTWRLIEGLLPAPGPFIYRATRSGLNRIEL